MSEMTRESLIEIARHYHPAGFPVEKDDMSEAIPAHQRTPEHERFVAAWDSAMDRPEWGTLMEALKGALPSLEIRGGTQPFVTACARFFAYRTEPLPGDEQRITRIATAVSILAPLYVVYSTTQVYRSTYTPVHLGNGVIWERYRYSPPQLTFEPTGRTRDEMNTVASVVEEVLGARRFPMAFADVPLPELRVWFLNSEGPPTLLEALFSDHLENLP